ncbi:MAG TPA: hypothetical protein DDZ68_03795, partial [Parvularcula sp.]|nr:hypothetical protein [Parvularcula sp.]
MRRASRNAGSRISSPGGDEFPIAHCAGAFGEPPFLAGQEIPAPASSAALRPEWVRAARRIRLLAASQEPRA